MCSQLNPGAEQRIVVVYERVSTDKQDISRQAVQRDRAKHDYPGRKHLVLQDDGVSAYKVPIFDRTGGGRLCELIESGHVEAVYADAQDRLSRGRLSEWTRFWDLCERAGTQVFIDGRGIDFADESDEIMGALGAIIARRESREKSHRVKGGKRRAAERGDPHGGWAAYGLRYGHRDAGETPGLHVVGERAAIVARVFGEWRRGVSQKQIARDLNLDGVRPDRTEKWGQSTIGRMLRNPTYAGFRRLDGELIPLTIHPEPILTLAEWEEAQRLLSPPGEAKRSGRPAPGFLLRGLLICGICGKPMHCRRGRARGRLREGYSCYTRHKDPTACSQKEIPRHRVDEGVLEYFEAVCLDAEASWATFRASADTRLTETRALREAAERESMKLASQLDRADDDYGSGNLDASDYSRLTRKWKAQREAADAEAERLREREAEIDQEASPDFLERLVRLRESVAARVRHAGGDDDIEAVRAALAMLFEGFVLTQIEVEEDDGRIRHLVTPQLRSDVLGTPSAPGRVTLNLAPDGEENKSHVAEALSYRAPPELAA